jgi:hypothetical protein
MPHGSAGWALLAVLALSSLLLIMFLGADLYPCTAFCGHLRERLLAPRLASDTSLRSRARAARHFLRHDRASRNGGHSEDDARQDRSASGTAAINACALMPVISHLLAYSSRVGHLTLRQLRLAPRGAAHHHFTHQHCTSATIPTWRRTVKLMANSSWTSSSQHQPHSLSTRHRYLGTSQDCWSYANVCR